MKTNLKLEGAQSDDNKFSLRIVIPSYKETITQLTFFARYNNVRHYLDEKDFYSCNNFLNKKSGVN